MRALQPPDRIHLQAAQGWLGLGDHVEAHEELEEIAPELRAHPAVLKLQWEIYAAAKKWDAALFIAAARPSASRRLSHKYERGPCN